MNTPKKMYLYKPVALVDNRPSIHPDNSRDLDSRREPMDQVADLGATRVDDYNPDTIGDPEGSARRAEYTDAFPPWIYYDYELTTKTIWGGTHKDRGEHLIPRIQTVNAVISIHNQSLGKLGKIIDLAYVLSNQHNLKGLSSHWNDMINDLDGDYKFPHMNALGNMTRSALADRAFHKYQYATSLARVSKTGDAPADPPEWLLNAQLRMINASTMAGTLLVVHGECWKTAGYKNAPSYKGLDYDIKRRLVAHAEFLEKNHRKESARRPDITAQMDLIDQC